VYERSLEKSEIFNQLSGLEKRLNIEGGGLRLYNKKPSWIN